MLEYKGSAMHFRQFNFLKPRQSQEKEIYISLKNKYIGIGIGKSKCSIEFLWAEK